MYQRKTNQTKSLHSYLQIWRQLTVIGEAGKTKPEDSWSYKTISSTEPVSIPGGLFPTNTKSNESGTLLFKGIPFVAFLIRWKTRCSVFQAVDRGGDSPVDVAWVPCYRKFMIQSFKDQGTEDVYDGKNSKAARSRCPNSLWKIAVRKLDQLDAVGVLDDLKVPPGNRLEALAGNRAGQHSIRINQQYRICFVWHPEGPDVVEIVDYH